MQYLPFIIAGAGLVLVTYSLGCFDLFLKLLPKKGASSEAVASDVVGKFVEIRKMLIGKVDDATLAAVDKVILDAVSGAKKDDK